MTPPTVEPDEVLIARAREVARQIDDMGARRYGNSAKSPDVAADMIRELCARLAARKGMDVSLALRISGDCDKAEQFATTHGTFAAVTVGVHDLRALLDAAQPNPPTGSGDGTGWMLGDADEAAQHRSGEATDADRGGLPDNLAGNWTEDFEVLGRYYHVCPQCRLSFLGGKGRAFGPCKTCASKSSDAKLTGNETCDYGNRLCEHDACEGHCLRKEAARRGVTVEQGPTQWAYKQACAALEKHRLRADAAEATITELREKLAKLRALTDKQAEDPRIWAPATHGNASVELRYVTMQLRQLTAAIEGTNIFGDPIPAATQREGD